MRQESCLGVELRSFSWFREIYDILIKLMGYGSVIQTVDRLSVRSVMRGSTSTLWGILGTLILLGLCLGIYIPPTLAFLKGDYYESQFFTQDLVDQNFYSNRDFKIAIQFRHKANNSVANHNAMKDWAYVEFFEYLADHSDYWREQPTDCRSDYLMDAINPVKLDDCFIFPQNALFDVFTGYGYYTSYTNIFFWLYPQADDNPFSATFGSSQYLGYELLMNRLLDNYYYIVYFTSRLLDPRTGKSTFQVNRFYSTDTAYSLDGSTSIDLLIYSVKHYNLDISVMPWRNNITAQTLVWLGQQHTISSTSPQAAAAIGIEVDFSLNKYGITSYRYYKKLDWLLGIIGGAMLLFYIILWVPCNYMAKTSHQMRNAQNLLLLSHSRQGEPLTEDLLSPVYVSNWYWVSNPVLDCFFSPTRSASKMVEAGEEEVDIVYFLKKLKVAERSLNKKELLEPFKPKVLKMKSTKVMVVVEDLSEAPSEADAEGNRELRAQQEVIEQIVEEDFVELPVDDTSGLTDVQLDALVSEPRMGQVYENHMVACAFRNDKDQTMFLKEIQDKSRFKAKYSTKKKMSVGRRALNCLARVCRYFDCFGARPNLVAEPHNSSMIGCMATLLIIGLSILTFALTIKNAGVPELMINSQVLGAQSIGYSLVTGKSLKYAICFSAASSMRGTARKASLRLFTESKAKGRQYYIPTELSSADYGLFDLTAQTSPINLNYCFGMPPEVEVWMGADRLGDYGYFGIRVQPYCSSTASYCLQNQAINNQNFLSVMNSTSTYLMLPENRFDPNTTEFINNLVITPLNINNRYMNNLSALEETVEVDQVRVMDDTQNWFMRKEATIKYQGISSNENMFFAISRNIISPGSPYYEARVRPSERRIDYEITTKKADTLLAIIGGVFVLWYAIIHWLGKVYNSHQVRYQLAYDVYYQESNEENQVKKWLALSPLPTCMIPSCFHLQTDVRRMRQIDKKIQNDLHYLYLVRNVDTIFHLSSALFERVQAKNLSQVFVKQKLDESEQIVAPVEAESQPRVQDSDFLVNQDLDQGYQGPVSDNKVLNATMVPEPSFEELRETEEKMLGVKGVSLGEDGEEERFQDNYVHGLPKQPRFNWLDTFEYPAGFTFNGKREVTSCCGGCACMILLLIILIIVNFQVGIYLKRSDTKIGMSTEMMQPLQANSNDTYNSEIHLTSGQNFKLGVTFSSAYNDYPHDITNWTNSAVGISVFQQIYTYSAGTQTTQTVEVPLTPCPSDYFTSWMNGLVDPAYYSYMNLGYCLPDGITLSIDGIPEDPVTKRFSLSIYNKLKTTAGNLQLKQFMQYYIPKFHMSNPQPNFKSHKFDYTVTSMAASAFNVTNRVSVNVSLNKVVVFYDDQIGYSAESYRDISYAFAPFQQYQNTWVDNSVDYYMSYNLSFANSFQVEYYTVKGDKFYETFGVIGGLIALFIFGLGCCSRSFNQYRMRYLIGRELYLFDILRKKQARAAARGRKKSRDELTALSDANKMSEGEVLWAYISSFPAALVSNYNLNSTLRRVTLIQGRVAKDLSLFEVFKKIHNMRDILNKQFPYSKCPISNIHFKHIYNPEPEEQSLTGQPRILSFAKKHNWSCFEQWAVFDAAKASINLKAVFDNAFLEKEFNMEGLDRTSIHMSQFGGTQGSIGTNSIGAESDIHPGEEEEERER